MSRIIKTDEGRLVKRRWVGPVIVLIVVLILGGIVWGVVWLNGLKKPAAPDTARIQIDEKALEGDGRSDNVRIAAQTAATQEASGDSDAAATTLSRAINGTSNVDEKVSLYMQLATLYGNKGDKANALANEDAAIKLQPNNWRIYKNQGSIYTSLGDSAAAKVSYAKSLELIKGTSDEASYANELKGLASGAIE